MPIFPVTREPARAVGPSRIVGPPAPTVGGPTVTAFETSDWTSTGTPKTITVTGAVNGDKIVVLYGGDNGTGGSNVTAATVSTTGGSTGTWTEPEEGLAASGQCWASSSTADVTADGTVTVSLSRTQSAGHEWGGAALLFHGYGAIGVHARSAPSATETASLAVSAGSAIGMIALDWDDLAIVAFSPAGAIEVQRSQDPNITVYAAYWTAQAAGTRGYGIATSSTTNLHIIAIEVLAASGGPTASGVGNIPQRSATAATTVKQAAGTAASTGRSATTSTGRKVTTGDIVDPQRSATAATVRKTSVGAGVDQQRTSTTVTGKKAAAAAGVDVQRVATSSSGTATAAGVTGIGVTVQRSSTTSTGRKTAASAALDQQRSVTQQSGRKIAANAGMDLQRSTSNVTSLKSGAGAALDLQRAATLSTGAPVVGIGGTARPTQRSSVTSTGRKTTTSAGLASSRATTATSGTHRATGAALAAIRSHDRAGGLRSTSGAARVNQRCIIAATGQQFALFTPLTDPVAAVRGNDAAARPRIQPAAAAAGNTAATEQRENLAAAAARNNPAEATT